MFVKLAVVALALVACISQAGAVCNSGEIGLTQNVNSNGVQTGETDIVTQTCNGFDQIPNGPCGTSAVGSTIFCNGDNKTPNQVDIAARLGDPNGNHNFRNCRKNTATESCGPNPVVFCCTP